MNNSNINPNQKTIHFSLLNSFFKSNDFCAHDLDFSDLHDQLNLAKANDIIIYHLHADGKSQELLINRINQLKANPKLIIFSSTPQFSMTKEIPFLVVKEGEWQEFLKCLLDQVFPMPGQIKFVGITGTNGKTSTSYYLHHLLKEQGVPSMLIGTLGLFIDGCKQEDFLLTSPGYFLLRKYLDKYRGMFQYCIFEMSSHALDQDRFYQIKLDAAGWTSFTQDHLDYHKTMNHYFVAKMKIFNSLATGAHVFFPMTQGDLVARVQRKEAVLINQVPWPLEVEGSHNLFSMEFMRDNLAVAVKILDSLILKNKQVPIDWKNIPLVPGRMNYFLVNGAQVYIDFAHTPDALENACKSLRFNYPTKKLKVLFGCGGNKDRTKRPLMGAAVSKWADYIFLTSDNPRYEEPDHIIDDIIPGVSISFERHPDREFLLTRVLKELTNQDVLLIAGKGHENYIQVKDIKYPYSDEGVVRKLVE